LRHASALVRSARRCYCAGAHLAYVSYGRLPARRSRSLQWRSTNTVIPQTGRVGYGARPHADLTGHGGGERAAVALQAGAYTDGDFAIGLIVVLLPAEVGSSRRGTRSECSGSTARRRGTRCEGVHACEKRVRCIHTCLLYCGVRIMKIGRRHPSGVWWDYSAQLTGGVRHFFFFFFFFFFFGQACNSFRRH
jgi:hypothetical protein